MLSPRNPTGLAFHSSTGGPECRPRRCASWWPGPHAVRLAGAETPSASTAPRAPEPYCMAAAAMTLELHERGIHAVCTRGAVRRDDARVPHDALARCGAGADCQPVRLEKARPRPGPGLRTPLKPG